MNINILAYFLTLMDKLCIIYFSWQFIDFTFQWGVTLRQAILAVGVLGGTIYHQAGILGLIHFIYISIKIKQSVKKRSLLITSPYVSNLLLDTSFDDPPCDLEDYSPCRCYKFWILTGIKCVDVDLPDVKMSFEKHNESDIANFLLHFPQSTDIISDLIGSQHRITETIDLACSKIGYYSQRQLTIHPDAFRSSRNYTKYFKISYCNLSRLDFSFLAGFQHLKSLNIRSSVNVHKAHWDTMPQLPSLSQLTIQLCRIFEWKIFPNLVTGLHYVNMISSDLSDETMDRVLDWLLRTSYGTLKDLHIIKNAMTLFPAKLSSFRELEQISLTNQVDYSSGMPLISKGSFVSRSSPLTIDLRDCGIQNIEPGAFSGSFGQCESSAP